ncbi:flippase [candidate division KSB1 bacterium]|nr:MAG: flippase [candidate division KSB1 bacterium]MBC6948019.1 flippase [candidate division KSB1 bacterium]MCE7943904.1 flippase [Chlorobi bacterium CHB1]MDL1876485.1 flippase [Cytophagia bacterium CHB2]
MELAARLRWNSIFLLLSSGIRLLTNALLFLGLARFYGPEAFGQFTIAHTLATLFLLVADFGLDLLFTTEVARQRPHIDALFRSFAVVKLFFAGLAVTGMWLLPEFHEFSDTTRWLIYIFSFSTACNALTNFIFALFKGLEQFRYETRVSFVENLVLLLGLVVLGVLHAPLWLFAAMFAGTRFLGLLIAAALAVRFVRPRALSGLRLAECRDVMHKGWVFGAHLLFEACYYQLDTVLLALWKGDYVVGIYQAGMKLMALALTLPDILIGAVIPALSYFHGKDEARWQQLGKLLNKTLFFLALPLALIFFVYPEPVMSLIYGAENFAPAVPIMRVTALIILIRLVLAAYGIMLTTSGRHRVRMITVALATFLALGLHAYAIPRYGAYGAAWVSVAVNFFVAVIFAFSCRAFFLKWTLEKHYLLPGLLFAILGFMLWRFAELHAWYGIALVGIFSLLIIYFAGYSKNERKKMLFDLSRDGLRAGLKGER